LSTPTLLTQSSSEISHDKRISSSSRPKRRKKNPKDPWRKSFKGKLPQSFDLFLEHFQPKIDVEIKRDGCTTGKKQKSPSEGEL